MKNKKAENKQQARTAAVSWTDNAWEEYVSWQKEDFAIVDVINGLVEECLRHPFTGKGKPEPLRGNLTGFWSRRITKTHRLVYLPEDKSIYIVSCRYHY
jgi:toxin YoeB